MMVVVCAAGESKLKKGDGEEDENHRRRRPLCHHQGVRPSQRRVQRRGCEWGSCGRQQARADAPEGCSFAQQEGCSFAQLQCAGPQCAPACQGLLPPPNAARARHTVSGEDAHREGGGGMHARKGARALGLMSTPSLGLCSWRPRLMPARTPTHMHAHHGHSTQARRRHPTRSSMPFAQSSVTRTMLTSPRASGSTRCLRQSERLRVLAGNHWV